MVKGTIAALVLLSISCEGTLEGESIEESGIDRARDERSAPAVADSSEHIDGLDLDSVRQDLPLAVVELGDGAEVRFFAWDDFSAGFMIAASGGRSPVPEVEFDGLSVAEVFWALTQSEHEVPEMLIKHHAGLVFDGERPPWPEVVAGSPRGWALDWPVPRALAECNNSTFNLAHCTIGGSWVGANCAFDSDGFFSNDHYGAGSHGALRYHAAMCLDGGGIVTDVLYWVNNCPGWDEEEGFIWSGLFAANSYFAFTWIAPTSWGQKRRWFHRGWVNNAPGHRDWATKFGADLGCFVP